MCCAVRAGARTAAVPHPMSPALQPRHESSPLCHSFGTCCSILPRLSSLCWLGERQALQERFAAFLWSWAVWSEPLTLIPTLSKSLQGHEFCPICVQEQSSERHLWAPWLRAGHLPPSVLGALLSRSLLEMLATFNGINLSLGARGEGGCLLLWTAVAGY